MADPGKGPGGSGGPVPPPSFLDQNETGSPLSQGLDEGLDLPLGRFVESTCRNFGPIMICTWYWALPSENS